MGYKFLELKGFKIFWCSHTGCNGATHDEAVGQ